MLAQDQQYINPTEKSLPIILLLDVSTSMKLPISGRPGATRISELNQATALLIENLKAESLELDFLVSIITFGQNVSLHLPPTKVEKINWKDMSPYGNTPLGRALVMAKDLIEDRNQTPSRAYTPTVILVSDGEPNDSWEAPLDDFLQTGRSQKCDRMAIAIGDSAVNPGKTRDMLKRFTAGGKFEEPYKVTDVATLHDVFERVTMSLTQKAKIESIKMSAPDPNLLAPSFDIPSIQESKSQSIDLSQFSSAHQNSDDDSDEDSDWGDWD